MNNRTGLSASVAAGLISLAGCVPASEAPDQVNSYDGIGADETINLSGTEPFWGAVISGETLNWSTPDNIEGTDITVSRFAGNGGLGFSGVLEGEDFQAAITPGECSDGMSDRTYPLTATVTIGDEQFDGCAYSDNQPFTGDLTP